MEACAAADLSVRAKSQVLALALARPQVFGGVIARFHDAAVVSALALGATECGGVELRVRASPAATCHALLLLDAAALGTSLA